MKTIFRRPEEEDNVQHLNAVSLFIYSDLFTGSFKSVWYPEKDTI